MRLRRMVMFGLSLTALQVGCTTSPDDPISGSWTLQSWNSRTLSAMTYGVTDGYHEMLVSEQLAVNEDGTFTLTRSTRTMPHDNLIVERGSGQWSKAGSGYVFGRGQVPAELHNGDLMIKWSGDPTIIWSYQR